MSKITAEHLARQAVVYVRQSTQDQVQHNHESRRRQYGLVDRARELGWAEPMVIDDDLGRSGSGVDRPGFEQLLRAICEGRVGIVFALEASRLSRNGRDWHTLLEFCGLVGCVLADEDGVYDTRLANDRLVLGMKGARGKWSALHLLSLPWITIPNLGSHILAIVRRRLPQDWTERYHTTPVLIEPFVRDPALHRRRLQGLRLDPRRNHPGSRALRPAKAVRQNRKRTSGSGRSEKTGNELSIARINRTVRDHPRPSTA